MVEQPPLLSLALLALQRGMGADAWHCSLGHRPPAARRAHAAGFDLGVECTQISSAIEMRPWLCRLPDLRLQFSSVGGNISFQLNLPPQPLMPSSVAGSDGMSRLLSFVRCSDAFACSCTRVARIPRMIGVSSGGFVEMEGGRGSLKHSEPRPSSSCPWQGFHSLVSKI